MRSVVILTIAACAFAASLWGATTPVAALESAGDGWYWQSPQPNGLDLELLSIPTSTDIFAATYWGDRLLHSTDGGRSWTGRDLESFAQLDQIEFIDGRHGWLIGYSSGSGLPAGLLLRTTDGGLSFDSLAVPDEVQGNPRISFNDDRHGWLAGSAWAEVNGRMRIVGAAARTTDGGVTWQRLTLPLTPGIDHVRASDDRCAWVAGGSRLWATTDGGVHWASETPPGAGGISALEVGDAAHVYVERESLSGDKVVATLGETSDGGASWRAIRFGTFWNPCGIAVCGDTVLVTVEHALTDVQVIRRSTDAGSTWTSVPLGVDFWPWSLEVGQGGMALAVGGAPGYVWGSSDGGATWDRRASAVGGDLTAVDFIGADEGWAVGSTGAGLGCIIHTIDGAAWREQSCSGPGLLAVDFIDASNGWAVGEAGTIQHTRDGGRSWLRQTAGTDAQLTDVAFTGLMTGWAVGWKWEQFDLTGVCLRTDDGGATWRECVLPDGVTPFAVCFTDQQHGWLAGGSGFWAHECLMMQTTDAGVTWSTVSPDPDAPTLADITFADEQHGWAVGSIEAEGHVWSSILRTTDGGVSWAEQGVGDEDELDRVAFSDADNGWATGSAMFVTSDGGVTWSRRGPASVTVDGIAVQPGGRAWAVSGFGTILSTVDTAADTAAPATIDDADGLWHREDVTIGLRALDSGGSGVARTEYRVDGDPVWRVGAEVVLTASADHFGDGRHIVSYRSVDAAGNTEMTRYCYATIDTIGPAVRLGRRPIEPTLRRGAILRVPFRVRDASPRAVCTVTVMRLSLVGFTPVKRIRMGSRTTGERQMLRLRCNFGSGVFMYVIQATDLAGNPTAEEAVDFFSVR